MSETSIAWTHYTFNPWWGCTRVSPGCEHCYAETFARRLGLGLWGPGAARRYFDEKHWSEPLRWQRRREKGDPRHLVFCASMADVFEDDSRLDSQRSRLWALIELTPALTWQLLTKRPENVERLVPSRWMRPGVWPQNAWLGVTAEDGARARRRIPILTTLKACIPVAFVSVEPMLEAIDFSDGPADPESTMGSWSLLDQVDWVIVGGESGPKARPCQWEWIEDAVSQCRAAGVAPFVKQGGAYLFCPHDARGGHLDCFPPALRVREFPKLNA